MKDNRTGIPKKTIGVTSTENMKAACAPFRLIQKASVDFNVSYSALQRRLNYPALKPACGQLNFSTKKENQIAELLLDCAKISVPLEKRLLMKVVLSVENQR
jgi:hypothetical protein